MGSIMKKNTASGVITFHAPCPVSLLKSEEVEADVKNTSESKKKLFQPSVRMRSTSECLRAGTRDQASASGAKPGVRQDWLSHATLRRLQAKMEAENQQAQEIIQPLLDTEKGLVKELERFLSRRDVTELRRMEVQHKRWTERVWLPLQRRLQDRVSSYSTVGSKRRQSLYNHYLHHCNTKGSVFLETYDLKEYNPFLLNIKQPHNLKPRVTDLKEPLHPQTRDIMKEKRTARSCEAGCKYKLPRSVRPVSESLASQADTPPWASSNYTASASRKTSAKDETTERKPSRPATVPHHIRATSTPDGRCHRSGCWFSGALLQPSSLHQSLYTSKKNPHPA